MQQQDPVFCKRQTTPLPKESRSSQLANHASTPPHEIAPQRIGRKRTQRQLMIETISLPMSDCDPVALLVGAEVLGHDLNDHRRDVVKAAARAPEERREPRRRLVPMLRHTLGRDPCARCSTASVLRRVARARRWPPGRPAVKATASDAPLRRPRRAAADVKDGDGGH
jgi:hypothetical protein